MSKICNCGSDYEEISGKGVKTIVNGQEILVWNNKLLASKGIPFESVDLNSTLVYVAINGVYAEYVEIADKIKENSFEVITDLKKFGINEILMLTGDNEKRAGSIAQALGITNYFSELLPQDQVELMEKIENNKHEFS